MKESQKSVNLSTEPKVIAENDEWTVCSSKKKKDKKKILQQNTPKQLGNKFAGLYIMEG